LVVAALVPVLIAASCSGDKKKPAAASSSSAAPPTTAVPAPSFPLTGLPLPTGVAPRPALSVKIDNVDSALPQSGLNNADIVYEELVEGGQSRLFVTFHSQDSDPVGPIRSARPVDADLLAQLGGGVFAYSGAAPGEIAPVEDHSGATLLSNDNGVPAFYREPSKSAPHNVFASTAALYTAGTDAGAPATSPPPQFKYGAATGAPVNNVHMVLGQRATAGWHWNATAGVYERDQNEAPDVLNDGARVSAADVLIMTVKIVGTGVFDVLGEEDPLPVVIGDNPCWLLRDGQMIEGHWSRPAVNKPTIFTDLKGKELRFHPGRTWVELLPDSSQPAFS
jgi:hypothetical protein